MMKVKLDENLSRHLKAILASLDDFAGCIVIVESSRVRVRRPPLEDVGNWEEFSTEQTKSASTLQ